MDIKNRLQSYQVDQLPGFGWKKLELNISMSPDYMTLRLCSRFIVGVHDKCP